MGFFYWCIADHLIWWLVRERERERKEWFKNQTGQVGADLVSGGQVSLGGTIQPKLLKNDVRAWQNKSKESWSNWSELAALTNCLNFLYIL